MRRVTKRGVSDPLTNPVSKHHCPFDLGLRQKKGKFIATHPSQNIRRSFLLRDDKMHKRPITRIVSKTIVDKLEMVYVEDQKRQRPAIPLESLPLGFGCSREWRRLAIPVKPSSVARRWVSFAFCISR